MIVVADTSVVLNLACVKQERLLALLFKEVFAPPEVQAEFSSAVSRLPRFVGLQFPDWVVVKSSRRLSESVIIPLDPGEAAAISLAWAMKADAVLIDERAGRLAAIRLGLPTLGLLAVLLRAKESGYLLSVAPVLDALTSQSEFYMSAELRQKVLRLANEEV